MDFCVLLKFVIWFYSCWGFNIRREGLARRMRGLQMGFGALRRRRFPKCFLRHETTWGLLSESSSSSLCLNASLPYSP